MRRKQAEHHMALLPNGELECQMDEVQLVRHLGTRAIVVNGIGWLDARREGNATSLHLQASRQRNSTSMKHHSCDCRLPRSCFPSKSNQSRLPWLRRGDSIGLAPLMTLLLVALAPSLNLFMAPTSLQVADNNLPIILGAYTDSGGAMPAVDEFATLVGGMPGIIMWYQDWSDPYWGCLANNNTLDGIVARGAVPMVTWEPWLDSQGLTQPDFSLRTIIAGDHDDYIRRCAQQIASWKGTILIRFAEEMNGNWTPWSPSVNGNSADEYVTAWQHVVEIFRQQGATNVEWVWSPNVDDGRAPFAAMYPGDEWVDWVALDGYNWGPLKGEGAAGWKTPSEVFSSSYDILTSMTDKPLMLAETASTEIGGDKAAWIRELWSDLPARMPRVRAVVWFNKNQETDWRVNSSDASLIAFREIVASAGIVDSASYINSGDKCRRKPQA